jgi:hypothetical protein
MGTYRLSAAGRRLNLALLIGALVIWLFALWSFSSTLGISYSPLRFWGSVQAALSAGLGVGQVVPALLMLVLIVATPLLIWNVFAEWSASYTPAADGLQFTALGVDLTYPWSTVAAIRPVDDDHDEPLDEVIFTVDQTPQIANPVLRALQRQAHGRARLLIYAGLEDRDGLIATIRERSALPAPPANTPAPITTG